MTACYAVLVRGLVGVWRPLVAKARTFTAKIVYLILVVILEQRKFKH